MPRRRVATPASGQNETTYTSVMLTLSGSRCARPFALATWVLLTRLPGLACGWRCQTRANTAFKR
jgi:hypothetical protein